LIYVLLHRVVTKNNFGIVDVDEGGQELKVVWRIYGNSGEGDEIAKLRAVELK
jgi:hypothetical protein